jgi:lysophospholipase L1-like esterase
MQYWARSMGLGLLGWAIAATLSQAHSPGLELVRPRTGGQLYVQRVITLQTGQIYSALPPDTFADQWHGAKPQPTHEQWQQLLTHEAAVMADRQGQSPVTVLVGDSIGLWLPTDQLPGDRLWLNQSISGETTAHMVRRIPYFAQVRPTTIVVLAGVNDLKNNVDPAVTISNMELLVQRLRRQHGQSRVVVLSILPTRVPTIPTEVVGPVNRQLAIAVERRGAEFIDLQPAFGDAEGQLRSELTTDGIHLTGEGYSLLASYLSRL